MPQQRPDELLDKRREALDVGHLEEQPVHPQPPVGTHGAPTSRALGDPHGVAGLPRQAVKVTGVSRA